MCAPCPAGRPRATDRPAAWSRILPMRHPSVPAPRRRRRAGVRRQIRACAARRPAVTSLRRLQRHRGGNRGLYRKPRGFVEPARAQRRHARPQPPSRSRHHRGPRARAQAPRSPRRSSDRGSKPDGSHASSVPCRPSPPHSQHPPTAGAPRRDCGCAAGHRRPCGSSDRCAARTRTPALRLYLSRSERPLAGGELRCKLCCWRALLHGIQQLLRLREPRRSKCRVAGLKRALRFRRAHLRVG